MENDDLKEEQKEIIEVGYISFRFPITRDEAEAIVNKPKSQVARKLKTYMRKVLEAGAKKMLETNPEEEVNNCKVEIEE